MIAKTNLKPLGVLNSERVTIDGVSYPNATITSIDQTSLMPNDKFTVQSTSDYERVFLTPSNDGGVYGYRYVPNPKKYNESSWDDDIWKYQSNFDDLTDRIPYENAFGLGNVYKTVSIKTANAGNLSDYDSIKKIKNDEISNINDAKFLKGSYIFSIPADSNCLYAVSFSSYYQASNANTFGHDIPASPRLYGIVYRLSNDLKTYTVLFYLCLLKRIETIDLNDLILNKIGNVYYLSIKKTCLGNNSFVTKFRAASWYSGSGSGSLGLGEWRAIYRYMAESISSNNNWVTFKFQNINNFTLTEPTSGLNKSDRAYYDTKVSVSNNIANQISSALPTNIVSWIVVDRIVYGITSDGHVYYFNSSGDIGWKKKTSDNETLYLNGSILEAFTYNHKIHVLCENEHYSLTESNFKTSNYSSKNTIAKHENIGTEYRDVHAIESNDKVYIHRGGCSAYGNEDTNMLIYKENSNGSTIYYNRYMIGGYRQ